MNSKSEKIKNSRGRPALTFITKFFNYNSETDRATCVLIIKDQNGKEKPCGQIFKGKVASRLEKHIFSCHRSSKAAIDIAAERRRMNDKRDKNPNLSLPDLTSTDDLSGCSFAYCNSPPASKKRKTETITIAMTRENLQAACVELTTTNGRSFALMEDSGMRMILAPIIKAFQVDDINFTVNSRNVRDWVMDEAATIRNVIRKEVKGKMISVKLDMATRLDPSILAVNIQYCQEDEIILKCLCVKQIYHSYTAENLQHELFDVLNSYGIAVDHIYTITTDDENNLVKIVDFRGSKVDSRHRQTLSTDDENDFDFPYSSDEEHNIYRAEVANSPDEQCIKEEIAPEASEEGVSQEILSWPLENIVKIMADLGIMGMRCAAHSLQLAIIHGINSSSSSQRLISKVRNACKLLRTPRASEYLHGAGRNKPLVDDDTRWLSTLTMLLSFLPLKDVFSEAMEHCKKNVYLTESEWEEIKDVSEALLPAHIATNKLQVEQLTVGDFFATWLRCKLDSAACKSPLGNEIAAAMDRHERVLLSSDTIVGALFLDPRYQVLLGNDERKRARLHLFALWKKLKRFQDTRSEEAYSDSEENMLTDNIDDDPVERLLHFKEVSQKKIRKAAAIQEQTSMDKILLNFEGVQRLKATENVLKYWKTNENFHPELHILAMTALSVPMTQVSVARVFSNTKFIFNIFRSNLDPNLTNDILVVRCNKLFMRTESEL